MPAARKTMAAKVVNVPSGEGPDPVGTFEAIVSVFDNVDHDGDIVAKGAFADTLKKWAASEDPMPLLWSHQGHDPESFLGHVVEAKETPEGLWIKAVFNLNYAKAARVYDLMKQGLIKEFSWFGEVLEYEWIEPEEPDAWFWTGMKILKVDLWEVGPCFKGANPETSLISIKASDMSGALGDRLRKQASVAGKELDPFPAALVSEEPPAATESESADDDTATPAGDDDSTPDGADTTTDVPGSSQVAKARALLGLITIQ